MANPFQEYEKARNAPIPVLIAVLNGQSDFIADLGIAHSALKEKMQAEVAKKGAEAGQIAQAPKVRDRDIAMAQGLANTPADIDVPMGGIVGSEGQMTQTAAGGGSVVAFQAGGQMELPFDDPRRRAMMSTRTPGAGVSFSQAFADRDIPKKNFIERGLGALRNMPYVGKAFRLASSPMAATAQLGLASPDLNVGEQEYLDLIRKLSSLGYTAEVIEAMTPEQRVAAAAQGPLQAGPTDTGGVPTQTLAQMEAGQAKPEGEAAPGGGGVADLAAAQSQVAAPSSYSALMSQAKEAAKAYQTEAGTEKTLAQTTQERLDALKAAGYDFNLVRDQIADVARQKEELEGDRKEAANLRLLEAGLGILGGESPYAFVNIGKGATPALQGLAKDLKEIKKTRRELDKDTAKLSLLRNQMIEGDIKFDQDRLDKEKARVDRRAEKNAEVEFRMFDRMASNDIQRYVANVGAQTARTNLQATNLEREAKRDADLREMAIKQAAEEVKMMPAEQQEAEKRKRAAKYYQMLKDKDFGAAPSGNVLRFDAQGNPI